MWCVLQKWGNFAHFQSSISPLSLMMGLRFSLLTCRNSYIVYPKNVFNGLELERSNGTRVLHCPIFTRNGNKVAFKDFQNFQETEFHSGYITIFRFFLIFHFGRNGVKFHKSLLLKHHTCTQHIGDHNFQETIASAPGQYMLERYYKKIHLAELDAIYQMGEFFKIFKVQYLCYF